MVTPAYSVIVPVRDEAQVLRRTVPALLAAAAGDAAQILYVCNGCTDGSAALIRTLAGPAVTVVEIAEPGKTRALNAGDDLATAFPRFYVDADLILPPGAFARLAAPLQSGAADLVSPRLAFETQGLSPTARAMAETWLALPHARRHAHQAVIGLSASGRASWGRFPEILGDDIFIAAHLPAARKRILPEVTALTRPPARFSGWVRMRSRWLRGQRELAALGLAAPPAPGQRRALLRRLATPRHFPGALAFLAARLLAAPHSRLGAAARAWRPNRPPAGQAATKDEPRPSNA